MTLHEHDRPLDQRIDDALATVIDPEIRRPITELGMVDRVQVGPGGVVAVRILLTVSGCPMKDSITRDVKSKLLSVEGVSSVDVELGSMTPEQRADLKATLTGGNVPRTNPFADAANLTRVVGIASGKGGVGKSTVTVNLACAMAAEGLSVGIVDADVHGFSIPTLMGTAQKPIRVDGLMIPPVSHRVKVISAGMFTTGNAPVVWRGPMLHRALEQFLTEVHFGDLDILLIDLPPGTGDMAISVSKLLPGSGLVVVTTPQPAAVDVAERAGTMARQTDMKIGDVSARVLWAMRLR